MSVDGKNGHQGKAPISPEDREALLKRASEIGQRLDEVRQSRSPPPRAADRGRGEAMAKALRVSSELIGGIVVGGALGWYLDEWLGTRPLFFIVLFLLGSAAGMLNVVRSALKEKTPPAPSVKDDENEEDR